MSNDKKDGQKMSAFTMRVEKDLLKAAKRKASITPLSRIIRLLLQKWIQGEIELDLTRPDEE